MYIFVNFVFRFFYTYFFKPLAFASDPENVHDRMLTVGILLGKFPPAVWIMNKIFSFQHPRLEQTIFGIHFKNPVGLSGGFDKDGVLLDILPAVGFGFVEVGSVTGEPCAGNPKPRLWRLIQSKSLLVYYGLKSRGSEEVSKRLQHRTFSIPIGMNIAKTNSADTVDTDKGIADYAKAFRLLKDIGAYITVNISCPNAYGGQPFTDAKRLEKLLHVLDTIPTKKPIFLKLSPDLSYTQLDEIISVVKKHRIHGFISTNLTKERNNPHVHNTSFPDVGGMSGKIVEELSNQQIAYLYKKTKGKYCIIGVGGVFTGEDAYKKIKLGASLVELITGMVFKGPQQIGRINYELVSLLQKDGYNSISEAIGIDNGKTSFY